MSYAQMMIELIKKWAKKKKKKETLFYWKEHFYHYKEHTVLCREKGEENYKEYELIELIPLDDNKPYVE